jgi:hypothetical protein
LAPLIYHWLHSSTIGSTHLPFAIYDAFHAYDVNITYAGHDQYFVSKVAKEVWVVHNSKVDRVESFDSYRAKQLANLEKSQISTTKK